MTEAINTPITAAAQSPATIASTVKHMAGMLWYEMLSDMNASGLSDDTLGTGGSDFQSMFLWNLAQNDFGKYDSSLNAAAVSQLAAGTGAAAASGAAPSALAVPISSSAPALAQIAAILASASPAASASSAAAPGAAAPGAAAPGATASGATPSATFVTTPAAATVPSAQLIDRAKTYAQKLWPDISAAAQTLGVSPVAILAQSALETGWGAAAAGNNYFGIKASPGQAGTARPTHEVVGGVLQAQSASFRDYASPTASVADYVGVIQSGFQGAVGQSSIAGYAQSLQANGYATDPGYAAKIVAIAQSPVMQQVLQSLPAQTASHAGQTSAATSE